MRTVTPGRRRLPPSVAGLLAGTAAGGLIAGMTTANAAPEGLAVALALAVGARSWRKP